VNYVAARRENDERGADGAGMLVKDVQEEERLPKVKGALHILYKR
jgi:hypothetical protein